MSTSSTLARFHNASSIAASHFSDFASSFIINGFNESDGAIDHSTFQSSSDVAMTRFTDTKIVEPITLSRCLTVVGTVFAFLGALCLIGACFAAFGSTFRAILSMDTKKKRPAEDTQVAKDLAGDEWLNGKKPESPHPFNKFSHVIHGRYTAWDADDTDIKDSHLSDDSGSDYDGPAKPDRKDSSASQETQTQVAAS